MKNYELDLKNSKIDYIPQTQRKYFKKAVEYCQKNNFLGCKINRVVFIFDFEKLEVNIRSSKSYNTTYKIKEV